MLPTISELDGVQVSPVFHPEPINGQELHNTSTATFGEPNRQANALNRVNRSRSPSPNTMPAAPANVSQGERAMSGERAVRQSILETQNNMLAFH